MDLKKSGLINGGIKMDILIFCNGLHTRTYLNAKITRENSDIFEVTYSDISLTFDKEIYDYKISK